ncbi:Uncharacterised protein [Klebsiella variicola]|nr:Uncharacterised protein [Klebsiella variicola]
MYFDATGFLAVIIRNRHNFAMLSILRFHFFSHAKYFFVSANPGKPFEPPTPVSHSIFTVIPGSHFEGTPKYPAPPPPCHGPIISTPDCPLTLKWLMAQWVWLIASMVPPPPLTDSASSGWLQPVNSNTAVTKKKKGRFHLTFLCLGDNERIQVPIPAMCHKALSMPWQPCIYFGHTSGSSILIGSLIG